MANFIRSEILIPIYSQTNTNTHTEWLWIGREREDEKMVQLQNSSVQLMIFELLFIKFTKAWEIHSISEKQIACR